MVPIIRGEVTFRSPLLLTCKLHLYPYAPMAFLIQRGYTVMVTLRHQTRRMIGTIFAGCTVAKTTMWAVTTVLRLTAIVVALMRLERE